VTPGLEELTAAELGALGLKSARVTTGGVRFTATSRQLYAANLWLRTATRVVVRIAHFEARSFAALEAEAEAIDWDAWLIEGRPARFRVSSTGSKLQHTGAIAERLHRVTGCPPMDKAERLDPAFEVDPLETPLEQLVVVRVVHDEVTISIDSSGAPLYQRGWRQDVAKAPLRESLAAALLLAAEWDPVSPLIDPMCGSGTIAIEAALLARGLAPGRGRAFAFADWPVFEPGTWASVIEQARQVEQDHQHERTRTDVAIVASDRDGGAIQATMANADRAGVAGDLEIWQRSVSDLAPVGSGPGLVLSNPPYGRRVRGGPDVRDLYARLGAVAKAQLPSWRVGLLVDDAAAARRTGLRLADRLRTTNGGIPVHLLVGPT